MIVKNAHPAVRPDLATFCHFGIILKTLGNFDRVYLVFGKTYFGNLINAIGQIFIVVNGRILNKSGHTDTLNETHPPTQPDD